MPVKTCAACGRTMNVDLARCPWCGGTGSPQAAPKAVPENDMRPCPFCREPIQSGAIKCRWCGEMITAARGSGPGAIASPPPPAPQPSYAPPAIQAPPGTTPLVLGILGLVMCGILAPFAWISGNSYEGQCRAMGVEPDGAGKAGKILGIIGTVFLILNCVCGGGYLAVVIAAAASGHS